MCSSSWKYFPVRGGILQRERARVYAVDRVSFSIDAGKTLGLVGESGCGKSTLARMLVRLYEPDSGAITLDGRNFLALQGDELKRARAGIQLVFQDPYASLNPRMSIGRILEEPFKLHDIGTRGERRAKVSMLLEQVGMRPDAADPFRARVLGRTAPAHRHRARDRARTPDRDLRRAGLRASTCRSSRRC